MSTLLIHTKLSIPATRRTQVQRPHLIAQFAALQEPGVKVGLVTAPPGFGKTSLLAEWVAQHTGQVAWLSLDENDNDEVRFWDYVIAALQKVHPGLGERVLMLLHEPNPLPLPAMVGMILNEIAALPGPLLLVLDDYHTIQTEEIHQSLTFLLAHMPAQMRLVIATRIEPPLPLARLRIQGELVQLRASDLRFSAEETEIFLQRVAGLRLDGSEVAALQARTEGWAAGLQVAALALQERSDPSQFLHSFAGDHRFILDYLVDEVLARQPAELQQFLLRSSILTRLNAQLCEWVTGQTQAQALLERLDRENLFVVALDEKREWYRYHQLFADFLRYHLQQQNPELIPELHRRASVWFERQGLLVEAVSHALAARDYEQAANLIEHTAEVLIWRRSELHTLQSWITALPAELLAARPRLNLYYAWVLYLTNHMGSAEQRAQQAAKALTGANPADDPLVPGMLAAIRSALTGMRREHEPALRYSRQALGLLPAGAISWRCIASLSLGIASAATGNMPEATGALTHAMELSQELGSSFAMLSAFWHLASLQVNQLALNAAEETCNQLLDLVQDPTLSPFPVEGHIGLLRGEIHLERNELAAAEQHLRVALEEINPEGFPMGLLRSHVALARVRQLQHDEEGVRDYVAKAEALVRSRHLQTRSSSLALYQARRWLEQGNLAAFNRWSTEQGLTVEGEIIPYQEPAYLLLARYLLLRARTDADRLALPKALTLLQRMSEQAERMGRTGSLIRTLVLYAITLAENGEQPHALETLAQAVALAEPERCIRVFADEGLPAAKLLALLVDAHRQGRVPAPLLPSHIPYVQTLLEALGQRTASPVYQPANVALVEPLSEREMEVLRLLADELSSNEIADRLVIAVETARKHIKNIYGKLDAHSRPEALRRSRELGLL